MKMNFQEIKAIILKFKSKKVEWQEDQKLVLLGFYHIVKRGGRFEKKYKNNFYTFSHNIIDGL